MKINKSALARQYNCSWVTIDRRLNPEKYQREKKNIIKEITIRFETVKGFQTQVDWKENLKIYEKNKNEYTINIFLIVLGYSRYKFIKLTFDKTQLTLFKCLTESFKYFEGTTEEVSQATTEIPIKKFTKEKEYLKPVNLSLLEHYYIIEQLYKVTNESMINYQGIKYSVPIKYIGKKLAVLEDNTNIHIYYNTKLITSYNKNTKNKFNYKKEDYFDILRNSSFNNSTEESINKFIKNNIKSMDSINIE